MRVLLIEDDLLLAKTIELSLVADGMIPDVTNLGEDGLNLAKLHQYNLVILDLMLPDINGYDIIRSIRAQQPGALLLILSGLGSSEEKVRGLSYGADDYITKPFNREELMFRIKAMVYRGKNSFMKTENLVVDADNHITYIDGKTIHLTNKEQTLLEVLSKDTRSIVSKKELLKSIYDSEDNLDIKIIDVLIEKTDKKLRNISNDTVHIKTIQGNGYLLSSTKNIPSTTK